MPAVDAVTFDYWNTLVATSDDTLYRRRAEDWRALLTEAGHDVTLEALGEAFNQSWHSFRSAWQANRQFVTADGVDRVLELLELRVEADLREVLIDTYGDAARSTELTMAPNLPETLDRLRAAGIRIGIICDVGMTPAPTLRHNLDSLGVLDRFDHTSFSDEVGTYKPDPAIFAHALEGLGSVPGRTAHVGDLRRTDVAGAKNAGWIAVRYAGLYDDEGTEDEVVHIEADHVVSDHKDLPEALGVA
jgi:putative hydrolase of the HAD superfamily